MYLNVIPPFGVQRVVIMSWWRRGLAVLCGAVTRPGAYPETFSTMQRLLLAALVCGPAGIGLVLAAAAEAIAPVLASMLFIIAAGALYWLLRRHQADIDAITGYIDAVTHSREAVKIADLNEGAAADVKVRISRAHRTWRRHLRVLGREVRAGRAIVDAIHGPFLMLDTRGRIIRANRAAQSLFGGGLIGRDFIAVVRHPDLLGAVKAVSGGEAGRTVEFVLRGAVERVFEARVSAFVDLVEAEGALEKPEEEDGGALFEGRPIILSLYDVTTMRRAEQLRADFVANASHELRTPLSSLIGFIETLRGPARDDLESHERFLKIMDDQARRMARLVQDLMSLSRIELVEHSPPTEPVDLAPICERVLLASEQRAQAVSVSLSLSKVGAVAPWVPGDADQLTQVVQNLVDNAIKYTQPNTAVRLELDHLPPGPGAAAYEQAGTVVLRVIDEGAGIPRDHVPRLTERLYRVDPARSRQLGGTGLGLAIVKHIVNRHRGRLMITSEHGVGSTFAVRLPALASAVPTTAPTVDTSQDGPAQL